MRCSHSKLNGDNTITFPRNLLFEPFRDRQRPNQNSSRGSDEWISDSYSSIPRNSRPSPNQFWSPRIALEMAQKRSQDIHPDFSSPTSQFINRPFSGYRSNLPSFLRSRGEEKVYIEKGGSFCSETRHVSPMRSEESETRLLEELVCLRQRVESEESSRSDIRNFKNPHARTNCSSSSNVLNHHASASPDSSARNIQCVLLDRNCQQNQWTSSFFRTGIRNLVNGEHSSSSDEYLCPEQCKPFDFMSQSLHSERDPEIESFETSLLQYMIERRRLHSRIIQNAWDALNE